MSTESDFSISNINLEFLPDWARKSSKTPPQAYPEPRADRPPSRLGRSHRPSRPGGGRPSRPGRDKRDRPPRRSAPPPPPPPSHLLIQFLPEQMGLESVIEQIRTSKKAYPVFSLARMFLDKPERHQVRILSRSPGKGSPPPSLFQCKICSLTLQDEAQAVAHALARHRSDWYDEEKITGEPPKGNFTAVARCELNGAILGPPNHHSFLENLTRLHRSKFPNMPLERFKQKVVTLHDPELVKKWQEQFSVKTTYKPKNPPDSPPLNSDSELERHFRQNLLGEVVQKTYDTVIQGEVSRTLDDFRLLEQIRMEWEKESTFPSALASRLCTAFTRSGIHIFKGLKRMLFATVIHPKFLKADPVDISPSIKNILEFIQTHPGTHRRQLLEKLDPAALTEAPKTEPPPSTVETAEAAKPPAPTPTLRDLQWLVLQGHVIEYHNGQLEAARPPPAPRQKAVPATETATPTSETTEATTTSPEETVVAQEDSPDSASPEITEPKS